MRIIEDLDYHQNRARAELDCGYRASSSTAADAHLRLSAMHMKRAQEISRGGRPALFGDEPRSPAATGIGSPSSKSLIAFLLKRAFEN